MPKPPTRLEAARRLLVVIQEMGDRLEEKRGWVPIGDLKELEPKAAYLASIAGLPNPPLERIWYSEDADMPSHGPTLNGVTLRPPVRPWDWPALKHRRTNLEFVFGYRAHDPYSTNQGGDTDLLLVQAERRDGNPPTISPWAAFLNPIARKYVKTLLARWTRFLERDLIPRLTADDAAPATITDGGEPEQSPEPTRAAEPTANAPTRPQHKRGGPRRYTDLEGDRRIAEAWDTCEHTTHVDLAKAMQKPVREVKLALDRHRKHEAKRSNR